MPKRLGKQISWNRRLADRRKTQTQNYGFSFVKGVKPLFLRSIDVVEKENEMHKASLDKTGKVFVFKGKVLVPGEIRKTNRRQSKEERRQTNRRNKQPEPVKFVDKTPVFKRKTGRNKSVLVKDQRKGLTYTERESRDLPAGTDKNPKRKGRHTDNPSGKDA